MTKPEVKSPKTQSGFLANSLIGKRGKLPEFNLARLSNYLGTAWKIVYFVMSIFAGVLLYFSTQSLFPTENGLVISGGVFSLEEISVVALCGVIAILMPLTAFLIRVAIPLAGTLFTLAIGYLTSFLANEFAEKYQNPIWLALVLSLVIMCSMAALYASGVLHMNQKFCTVVGALFVVLVFVGTALFLLSLVPSMNVFTQNAVLNFMGSAVFIVTAGLFLWVDFDKIHNAAKQKMSGKQEWEAAFSLVFTVIFLYLKLLDFLR
ncbi:MAG: Bax inhibitor-1/YccA family protein [Ruthenibacterium sp.]